jgi:hypothetical protein
LDFRCLFIFALTFFIQFIIDVIMIIELLRHLWLYILEQFQLGMGAS